MVRPWPLASKSMKRWGIETFILSGYPHLEEAYRVGELLFPHLDLQVPLVPQPRVVQAHGEAVANDFTPEKKVARG